MKQQQVRRLSRKVNTLQDVVTELQSKHLVSDNCVTVLEKCFTGAPLQLMLRQLAKHKEIDRIPEKAYPTELRAFALTLHFYSAKAYNYVRETFDLCLPHPKTLSKWYKCVDGNIGFSDQVIYALKSRADAVGRRLRCAMVVDEMAIRHQVECDGN